MTLREIRLFHWRQLMATRKIQEHANSEKRAQLERVAREHLGAVQCLNDFCPGTAEQDEANGIPPDTSVSPLLELRVRAIGTAGELAELCARYAAFLERSDKLAERAALSRELAAIFFRAAELERNR